MVRQPRRIGAILNNPRHNPLALYTPEALARWEEQKKAVTRIYQGYRIAVLLLGEEEALWHWKKATTKRGRGRPPGSPKPMRDRELLSFYYALKAEDPRLTTVRIGEMVYEAFSVKYEYGTTAGGVTQLLRRLLKKPPPN